MTDVLMARKEQKALSFFSTAGHATCTGLKNATPLYFVGAPIFEQTGRVRLLRHDRENWTEIQRLRGEQVTLSFFYYFF